MAKRRRRNHSIGDLIFSPDSKRIAYIGENNEGYFVVVDDIKGKTYKFIRSFTFSHDSKQFAYPALLEETRSEGDYGVTTGRKEVIVLNGSEGPVYDLVAEPIFSPDDMSFAYRAGKSKKEFVVIDNKELGPYDGVGRITFGPDSKQLAYSVFKNEKALIVLNGKEGKAYDGVGNLIFSSDSKQFAYSAVQYPTRRFVVLNGVEGKDYELVDQLVFSPNSVHLAYTAEKNEKMFVVMDGKEEPFNYIMNMMSPNNNYGLKIETVLRPTFSLDSKHFAYLAGKEGRWFIVLDEDEGTPYDFIWDTYHKDIFTFSQDDKSVLYNAINGRELWLIVDQVK